MAPISPTVAAWALGLRLREKREAAGLRNHAAAKQGGVAPAYLSDVENGKKVPAAERLDVLLDLYEFDDPEADELRQYRDQATRSGWWNEYSALFSEELLRFFGYEYGAESLDSYDSGVMNGLLQTEDYARAIITSGSPNVRLAEVELRTKCRMTRQKRVTDKEPLQVNAVMSEAVLRQQVGGPRVLADQLKHLGNLIDQFPETLDVRIVPFEATGNHAMGGSAFHLMGFASGKLPTLLWQETVTSTQMISLPIMVQEYNLAHIEATKEALDREASVGIIRDCYERL